MKKALGTVVILLLAGCAPQFAWEKKGVTELQRKKEFYECERDMRQSGYYGGGIAGAIEAGEFSVRCLEAKGYKKVPLQPAQPQHKK